MLLTFYVVTSNLGVGFDGPRFHKFNQWNYSICQNYRQTGTIKAEIVRHFFKHYYFFLGDLIELLVQIWKCDTPASRRKC